ncbi:dTDP-4-amino-4,6-dideoxygalactose transaminase [Campylobacter lanienae]|uniref:dTDP-4-amino-4,6-dideoxygalactose transaminase n=1 Tax=Campylobacter lanienae TaxID=75658 RepID=UPI000BB41418|nr:dTDP-4-amino-4,6-dideoxygalactose transaminase [Campylobacter lanienae]
MITFNAPTYTPKTLDYIKDVFAEKHASGDGKYTKKVHNWFKKQLDCKQTLLVHSGTAALEMAAILADLKPGDEVIMPSYTFCSTANAFVLQGAIPVFIDIRPDTLNIDETKIEGAITDKTKAIVVVHYAGVACEMDVIMNIAKRHNLLVIEDAAQAFDSFYKGRPLGTIGDIGCFSFHETKNIMSGEGGLFVTNNEKLAERAEIIREKGTNRSKFFRGQVDKYTWVDKGSSYLPSDIIAAYLYSILEISDQIQTKRISVWQKYYKAFEALETQGYIRRPIIPESCTNNGHMFYLLLNDLQTRTEFITHLKNHNIYAPFHYIPLHSAPAGENYCKTPNSMSITNKISDTLVRLPMFYDITNEEQEKVITTILDFWRR